MINPADLNTACLDAFGEPLTFTVGEDTAAITTSDDQAGVGTGGTGGATGWRTATHGKSGRRSSQRTTPPVSRSIAAQYANGMPRRPFTQ